MNTNRDASSYTARLAARAILQDRKARDDAIAAGIQTVPKAVTYDYSVLVPANPVQAFQPIAPWLYTSEPVNVQPPREIYGYPANAPQTITVPSTSLTYAVSGENYTVSVSSVFDPNTLSHSFVRLFNDATNDVWACIADEYKTTIYPGLDYSGAWIRVELPFAIYPTGVRLTSRSGDLQDQRPKEFRVYGQLSGEQPWNLLYDSLGVSWPYSGNIAPDQTKEFSFSSNVAYSNYLIIMRSNYYAESALANKNIHILPYISLAEYKIMGYPAEPDSAPAPQQERIVQFTSVGSGTWTAPADVTEVEYLVVGGAGGGGGAAATGSGGGGAGGAVVAGSASVIPNTSYNYTVGAGGAGGIYVFVASNNFYALDGSNGLASTFDSIIANGGGKGFESRYANETGILSKGGAAQNGVIAPTGGSGGGTRDNSVDGINGYPAAGGGGGAGGPGGNGSDPSPTDKINSEGGPGGIGITSSITGIPTTYGKGGRGGNEALGNVSGTAGAANRGEGGAGAQATSMGGSGAAGGAGGSGIVILKYMSAY